ncbi:phage tail protein [uncultured Mediterranean phage uvMED]|nr:phage tail protein [uncultured Mediterranean phage uvMED]
MAEIIKPIQQAVQKVVSWFIDIPEIPDLPQVEEIRGTLVNKQSNNAQIPLVYGERLLGGTRVFIQTSGTDNTYLYIALVLCEGEINAVTEIQVNDNTVTFGASFANGTEITSNDSNYGTTIKAQPFYGTDGQSASSLLSTLTNWGSNHKLSGICYVAFRFEWDADKYTGIPNIKVKVQGKKISTFDGSSNETTGQYSTNPAFVLLDFLRNERYGKGIPLTEIDVPSFYTASTIADTTVTYYTGTTGKLFECNAVLNTNKKILDNVKTLLRGMRGLLPYVQGEYKLLIESTGTATFTLNEDNIIGGVKLESERKDQKYNRVLVNFVNPEKGYQADTIVYDTDHATLKTADGGFLQEGNVTLDTINSPYQAHEFGKIVLQRSRNNLKLGLTVNYEALDLAIGDIVNVSSTILGMTNKPFRVSGMTLNANFTASLSLQEHQDSWYTFSTINEVATIGDTNFPDPFTVQPPSSVTLADELISYNDGTVIVAMNITIGASPDQFVREYQVEYKRTADSNFIVHSRGTVDLFHRVLNVISGDNYTVRVKAINSLGVESTNVTATRDIVGEIDPPSDVQDFAINIVGSDAHLSWESIPDADLNYYVINFTTETVNPEWQNSFTLINRVSRPATSVTVPARTGSYLIKAVDKLGNFSSNEAIITTNITAIGNFTNANTATENPDFTGTKTDCVAVDNALELDSIENFDDNTSDNFDDITTRNFDGGTTNDNVPSIGTYEFANIIDLGSTQTTRLTGNITQTTDDRDRLFDNVAGLFDDQASNFDGDASVNASSHLEIATSTDNITYTSFRNFNVGDYSARYFKFRLIMQSLDNSATPVVSALSVDADMQERLVSENDVASGAGTKSITFSPVFISTPAIGVSAQGLASGDFYEITNKSVSGFDITFKNGGTAISKTFDYIAKGH